MQGLTPDAIRYDAAQRLRDSATITGRIPADRIYDSRATPTDSDACIIVYLHSEAYDRAETGSCEFPAYIVASELVIEIYQTAATDDGVEGLLDMEQDVLTCLLNDATFTVQYWRIQSIKVDRDLQARGAKRIGICRIVLSLVHQRAWGP